MPVIEIDTHRKKLRVEEPVVLTNESEQSWKRFLEGYLRALAPADEAELDVVASIAAAQWRLRRLRSVETALLDLEMDRQAPLLEQEFEELDEGVRTACAYKELGGFTFSNLARQEEVLLRAVESGLEQLRQLRALRRPEGPGWRPPAAAQRIAA